MNVCFYRVDKLVVTQICTQKSLNLQQLRTHFNKMSEPISGLQTLLGQIKTFLEEWSPKYSDCSTVNRKRLVHLLEKVQSLQQSSKSTLTQIIQDHFLLSKLTHFLYLRLLNTMGNEKLLLKYKIQSCKPKETYFFMQNKNSTLIKEIIENIKAIEIEVDKLTENLKTIQQPSILADSDTSNSCDFQVGILLRLVMEASELQLQNPIDEMLFRLFILQESVTLILHKTEHVLNYISGRLPEFQVASGKSQHSNTKRSALSQSLLIFKMNKVKEDQQAEPRSHRSQQIACKQNQIKSDYMMQCRPEKKLHKAEQRSYCCFGF